ncbi:hypothetical protein PR048_021652 [Dryococelus australis]|uniref:Uncharacterized protein n=1 Tax=Dryococelus australis TaxID=614101 RepID=A0ABQ9GYT7_9NEOP|nr:hypothetical protein PR048_021652 [Dryococelus australis]
MARKSQSREERLKKKREAERKIYALMKTNPKEDPNHLQTFPRTNAPPESCEEELEICEEEELNYPHQEFRAVVDKEKKKVRSKKDSELKKKEDTIKKLKQRVEKLKKWNNIMKKKEQMKNERPWFRRKNKSLHHIKFCGEKYRHISSLKFLKDGRVKTRDKKGREKKQSSAKIERDITAFFEDDRNIRILPGKDVIKTKPSHLLQQICCDIHNENCLLRKCENCKSNEIHFSDFKENDIGVYLKWQTSKATYTDKNGNQKAVQKMNKDVITVNLLERGD